MIVALFILAILGSAAFGTKIAVEAGADPLDVVALSACGFILGYITNQVL